MSALDEPSPLAADVLNGRSLIENSVIKFAAYLIKSKIGWPTVDVLSGFYQGRNQDFAEGGLKNRKNCDVILMTYFR